MVPIVATAYDQNPARIASIARKSRKRAGKDKAFAIGTLATVAAGLAFVLNYLFTKAG